MINATTATTPASQGIGHGCATVSASASAPAAMIPARRRYWLREADRREIPALLRICAIPIAVLTA
jgi:hypothetical protein